MTIVNVTHALSALMERMPSVAIWSAILAGFSITGFLLVFSHPPLKLNPIQSRYLAATSSGFVMWILILWWKQALPSHKTTSILEFLAGGLIFVSAFFCNYYLGNVSAGFRIEMLTNLASLKREVTLDEWMMQYGKGQGMYKFLENRLNAILIPWGLVVWDGNQITLTRFGKFVGRVNCFLASLFSAE